MTRLCVASCAGPNATRWRKASSEVRSFHKQDFCYSPDAPNAGRAHGWVSPQLCIQASRDRPSTGNPNYIRVPGNFRRDAHGRTPRSTVLSVGNLLGKKKVMWSYVHKIVRAARAPTWWRCSLLVWRPPSFGTFSGYLWWHKSTSSQTNLRCLI